MNKNAITTIVGILLILYAITNFAAAFGQFAKAKTISGTTSAVSQLGRMAGDTRGADKLAGEAFAATTVLYGIALLILLTAVLDLTAAVGLFGGKEWAFKVVVYAALFGIGVEIQDTMEDGFGIGKLIFFAINILAIFAALSARNAVTPVDRRTPVHE